MTLFIRRCSFFGLLLTACGSHFVKLLKPSPRTLFGPPPLSTKPQPLHRGRLLCSATEKSADFAPDLGTTSTMALPDDKVGLPAPPASATQTDNAGCLGARGRLRRYHRPDDVQADSRDGRAW